MNRIKYDRLIGMPRRRTGWQSMRKKPIGKQLKQPAIPHHLLHSTKMQTRKKARSEEAKAKENFDKMVKRHNSRLFSLS